MPQHQRPVNPFVGNEERVAKNPFAGNAERKRPRGYRTPEQIERLNRLDMAVEELGPWQTIAGGAAAAGQGLLLGWGDEAAAALRALGPKRYREALADVRAEQSIFREEYPKADVALNIAGGGLLPIRGGGAKRTALLAGGTGAVAGAGYTEGGLAERGVGAGIGAGVGLGAAGLLGGGARVLTPARTVVRIARAPALGKTEGALRKARKENDAINYRIALTKWGNPLSPEMEAVLVKDDIAPIVARLKKMEQHKGRDLADPEFLDAVYKDAISDWKLQLDKAKAQPDPSKPNMVRALKEHIGLLRDQFLAATDKQMPGYRRAVEESAVARGLERAFAETADATRRVMQGTSIAGKNIPLKSPEAFARGIEKMTPRQAGAALPGLLGRGREAVRMTTNPVGKFGFVSSVAHSIKAPFQLEKYIRLLEAQAGRKADAGEAARTARRLVTRAITMGLLSDRE